MTTELFEDQFIEAPAPIIHGRSELERWSSCPYQAMMIERGIVSNSNTLTEVGSAVHDIIAHAVKSRREDGTRFADLRAIIEELAMRSRPDMQPEVIASVRRVWPIVDLICRNEDGTERHPDDIMRFDGGKDNHAGQLSAEIIPASSTAPATIITCELDLLLSTPSPKEVEIKDWKTGHAHWNASDVVNSFQFGAFYPYVVMRNYPDVDRVRVTIFMTRAKGCPTTSPATFERSQMYAMEQRIKSAIDIYDLHHGKDDAPALPTPEKCGNCPAATKCRLASEPAADVARDPMKALHKLIVLEKAAAQLRAGLSKIVRKGIPGVRAPGELIFGDVAFGAEKPVKYRVPTCKVYMIGEAGEESQPEESE